MNFSLERKDNAVIFTLKNNRLDSEISSELKAQILIMAQPDIDALAIDLSVVNYVDSSGLGALLLAHRQLKDYDIPVILVGVNDMVSRMLQITHISQLFEYNESIEEIFDEA